MPRLKFKKPVLIERRLKSWRIEYNFQWNQPYLSRGSNLSRGLNSLNLASRYGLIMVNLTSPGTLCVLNFRGFFSGWIGAFSKIINFDMFSAKICHLLLETNRQTSKVYIYIKGIKNHTYRIIRNIPGWRTVLYLYHPEWRNQFQNY